MTASENLTTFVNQALTRGAPRAEIEGALLAAGWSKRQARDALAAFADVAFPIPVPRPRPYTDAREAFLYGLLFVALYVSAYHLGMLVFTFIERAFPQAAEIPRLREAIRGPASVLVVALPVFVYVSRLIDREVRSDPSKRGGAWRLSLKPEPSRGKAEPTRRKPDPGRIRSSLGRRKCELWGMMPGPPRSKLDPSPLRLCPRRCKLHSA